MQSICVAVIKIKKSETPNAAITSTEISHLEYKGYKGILKLSSKDNRLWGKICTPENPTTPIDGWGFAGDDIQEAENIFGRVDKK